LSFPCTRACQCAMLAASVILPQRCGDVTSLVSAVEPNANAMANESVLLGDIGATNARLALFKDGALGPVEWMAAAEYAQFPDAVEAFLAKRGRPLITAALLAVAGPVEANRARMTNRGW